MKSPGSEVLTIVRTLKASPARVYRALTRPEQILEWWGPDAGPAIRAETDLRPGGRYSIVFRTLDGAEHNPTGTYLEIVPEQKLVFTWEWRDHPEWESQVTFLLRAVETGTELTVIHERLPNTEAIRSHESGWTGFTRKLQHYLGDRT